MAQRAAEFTTLRQLMVNRRRLDLDSFICKTIAKLQGGKGDILMHDYTNPKDCEVNDCEIIHCDCEIQDCDKPLTTAGKVLVVLLRELDDYLKAALKAGIDLFPGLNSIFQDSDKTDADIETKIAANEDLKRLHGIDMQGEWAGTSESDIAYLSTLIALIIRMELIIKNQNLIM